MINYRKISFFAMLTLLISSWLPAIAQHLDREFDTMLANQFPSGEPGAVALVAQGDTIIYRSAFGKANLELGVPMHSDMVFRLGSITKQFTAVAILMLMEDGKLSLDDPITNYLPDYPLHGHHITIHHLLTHTSGIANSTTLNPWDAHVRKKDFQPKELVDYFKNEPMREIPGTQFRYNNFGYDILGHIIELVSEQPYSDFIEQRIFEPLGMNNSLYASHDKIIVNRASGYTRTNDGFANPEYISLTQPYAAGALMSTVKDLFIWMRALVNDKVISKSSLQMAWTNYEVIDGDKINYGYGWFVNEINGSVTYEHAGGIQGFQTNAIYLPEEDVFVAVFTNCDRSDPRPVSTRMAALSIGKPYPDPEKTLTLTDEQLQKWVGEYKYPDGSTRIVELSDHQLYWSRPGRYKFRLLPTRSNRFMLEGTFTQVTFEHDEGNVRAMITARILRREAFKIR